jgi:TolB-like protein/Tfp pilus assembly protein PilF
MAKERAQRRLAAILAADVVGYSRLMEREEAGTLATLKARRNDVLKPLVDRHQGRIFKFTGDGVLVEFGSAVNAVQCAVELQHGMAAANHDLPESRRIVLRIGINLGDVMVEGSDLYGDGVNIAARLESIAEPGGIVVSAIAFDYVKNKVDCAFEDLGNQNLKNILEPVRIYRVAGTLRQTAPTSKTVDRPSIAVLPFTNMSADPEQEYFVDGLSEDLITDLSKVPGFLVIARNSTFAYKGKAVDIRLVARELGVRYVIEGSVRRSTTRVRINAQLIDALENTHLWANRFDRDLADVFLLQDEVVSKIVNALADILPSAHFPGRQRAANLEAYDLFVRGRELVTQSPESTRAARPLLEKAIELDPGFAEAHAWLAMGYAFGWLYGGESEAKHRPLALAAAERAVALDAENAVAHALRGYILLFDGKMDEGAAEFATALRINPSHTDALLFQGEMFAHQGMADRGIESILRAFRLNPHPPGRYYWILGYTQYAAGRYEDAIQTLQHDETRLTGSSRILAASLAQLGRMEEAREVTRRFLAANPHFSVRQWASTQPFRQDSDRQHFIDGYIKAGLPM